MKKLSVILSLVICMYFRAAAQTANSVEVGFNSGFNVAEVTSPQGVPNVAFHVGFNVGATAEYYLTDTWSIKGKISYDQKGWDDAYGFFSSASVNKFSLNYITVPVMANWHFGRTRNWYLHFGAYAGFLTGATSSPGAADISSGFNTTDAGLAGGLGVKFKLSDKAKLFIEDDSEVGFIDILKNDAAAYAYHNTRSSLNVGVMFRLD